MEDSTTTDWLGILGKLPTYLSLIAALAVTSSTTYQLGYLLALDPQFVGLFTVQDAIANALLLLPAVLGAILIMLVLTRFTNSRERSDPAPRWKLYVGLVILTLIGVGVFLFSAFKALAMFIFIFVAFAFVVTINSGTPRQSLRYGLVSASVFLVYSSICVLGAMSAQMHLAGAQQSHQINLVNDKKVEGTLLWGGSAIVLVRDSPTTVRAISRGQIRDIVRLNVSSPKALVDFMSYFGDSYTMPVIGNAPR